MAERQCPSCGSNSAEPPGGEAFPFCSRRCRLLDLGNWLDERYRLPDPEETPPDWPRADD